MRTVIVGASLAGFRVAEGLRTKGYGGEVILIGDEKHLPYDRPPLSKQVLNGGWSVDKTFFRSHADFLGQQIDYRPATTAVCLKRRTVGGEVICADGTVVPYDRLVLATGARARTLRDATLSGVQTLRTLEDVESLREALGRRPRITIVGGGFIGAEVASAARLLDLPTTMLEALPAPLSRVLGQHMGEACAQLYERHGVDVRTGIVVEGVTGRDHVEEVVLGDGGRIPSDLVLVGIGAIPNTEWLVDSGLEIKNGVVCNAAGRAAEDVWAVGDVARWYHPVFGEEIRVDHWTHATEQANHVAHAITYEVEAPLVAIPYVWSDQFGVKMQIAGRPSPKAGLVTVSGDPGGGSFVGVYVAHGIVVGAIAFNSPRAIALARKLIAAKADLPTALDSLGAGR